MEGAPAARSDMWTCARCHGEDARGGREGALRIPALVGMGGVRSPAELGRLLRTGERADGKRLSLAMPRYRLREMDVADLFAYVREERTVRSPKKILVLLPPQTAAARQMRAVMETAWAAHDLERRSGIPLQLHFIAPVFPSAAASTLPSLDHASGVRAALVAPGAILLPAELTALEAAAVPVITTALDGPAAASTFLLTSRARCSPRIDEQELSGADEHQGCMREAERSEDDSLRLAARLVEALVEGLARADLRLDRAEIRSGLERVTLPPRDGLPAVRFGRRVQ